MAKKVCYDMSLLQEVCERDKCIIDFDKIEKYNRGIKVEFRCNCGIEYIKTFRQIYDVSGGYCKICTKKKAKDKFKQTCIDRYGVENTLINLDNIRYTRELLENICSRDKCIIDFDKIEKYNREIRVDIICDCGGEYSKTFRQLYEFGAFCKICTKNKGNEKSKQTSIERYGVEHASQSQKAKDKSTQTCIERYGVEHSLQSQEVRDKSKQTCIEKYGVEHAIQSQEVKDKSKQTCIERYGVEYAFQSQEVMEKCKQTNIKNYGVEYASQSQEVRDKSKQTSIERYGVEHASQSQKAKDKSKQTCIERYGVENPSQSQEVKDKKIETCFNNFGVEYSLQSQEVRDKSKQTCILKYGVEYPMQNADFAEKVSKNSYKRKDFHFPCGTIQVQGYEPILLKNLVEEGYTYEDIITEKPEVPEIWYEKDNNKHRYYCDVYIPKINTIYEVKSTWTYEKDVEVIPFKKQACIDAGYLFELYVYDAKGIRQQDI
jgi:hypothetical protein